MALSSGTRLGPYEIVSTIGAGGMGEVYKAKDTRLDRIVALKVLPGHLADNAELRERLEREARAVSALNHPHICTLHDIGCEDGVDFLVMEYLEGQTLAERLERGALPMEEALRYGIQITDALGEAHRRGIVHRDLKPGNMILTKTGITLLDFGLAKIVEQPAPGADLSSLPTENKPLTREGTILGTFQYMAPEQLEGQEADTRTDIFAFGAVLYEMLTGKKAFEGKSQASLIGAIMNQDPAPISNVKPMTPPALERTLLRCIAKNPDERWQSARDLKGELEWIAEGRTEPTVVESGASKPWRWAIAGLIAGALVASGFLWSLSTPAPVTPTRLTIALPEGHQLVNRSSVPFALSPDGRKLTYAAETPDGWRLFLRDLEHFEPQEIPSTEEAHTPFFSPDGEWIGFFTSSALKKVALSGGSPVELLSNREDVRGASWGPDDTIYFAKSTSPVMKIPAGGGTPEAVTSFEEGQFAHLYPSVDSGGEALLFTMRNPAFSELGIFDFETSEVRALTEIGTVRSGQYLSSGYLVYATDDALLATRFDPNAAGTTSSPSTLVSGIWNQNAAFFSVSQAGTLAYVSGERFPRTVWVDRAGRTTPTGLGTAIFHNPRLSPDGTRLAFDDSGHVWVIDLERRSRTRLTHERTVVIAAWSPDSSRVVVAMQETASRMDLYAAAADGSTSPTLLLEREHVQWPTSYSPDGRYLALTEIHPDTGRDVLIVNETGEVLPFQVTEFDENAARFSPGGRFIAYQSNESGGNEIYVRAFPGPEGKWLISNQGGTAPVWSPNGKELFYREGRAMMVVEIRTSPVFAAGVPRELFDGEFAVDGTGHPMYDIAPDGERFLMVDESAGGALTRIHLVLNFDEELKRLAAIH